MFVFYDLGTVCLTLLCYNLYKSFIDLRKQRISTDPRFRVYRYDVRSAG